MEELFHHAFPEWNWSFGWQLLHGDVTSAQMSHKLGAGMRDGFKLAHIWKSLWLFNKTWGEHTLFQFVRKGTDEVMEIGSLDELTPSNFPIQLTETGRKVQVEAREYWTRDKGKRGMNGQPKKERKRQKVTEYPLEPIEVLNTSAERVDSQTLTALSISVGELQMSIQNLTEVIKNLTQRIDRMSETQKN